MSKVEDMREGLALWGRVCGNDNNCSVCPVQTMLDAGVTCQEFASKHPDKFLSILEEIDKGGTTYYQEFMHRFPNNSFPPEILAELICRKVAFEGYLDCTCDDTAKCIQCWKEAYAGDVTEVGKDEQENLTAEDLSFLKV